MPPNAAGRSLTVANQASAEAAGAQKAAADQAAAAAAKSFTDQVAAVERLKAAQAVAKKPGK